jgi:pimeloyl-ACP methyl ester carboxylesterase
MREGTSEYPNGTTEDLEGRYAFVNGLDMYFEVHGTGRPIVLLHVGLSGTGTSCGKLLPSLARIRQVIAVELQGHGHTADIDRPLRMKQLADDLVGARTRDVVPAQPKSIRAGSAALVVA